MALNLDTIVTLAKILDQKTFDERLYNTFIRTKGGKRFVEYEKSLEKARGKDDIKKELIKLVEDESYEDKYQFYKLKRNLNQLKIDIKYIKEKGDAILENALKEVYKIVPHNMSIKSNIYLYGGGANGGFTIDRKDIFINYGKYIGKKEEFIKILSHELYHSRKLSIESRIKFLFKMVFRVNRLIYGILGKALEEGIASLVQHGSILKVDDPVDTLTRRNLLLCKEQFDLLNDILRDIKYGRINNKKIGKLNLYIIGYHIVTTIYNIEGVMVLDHWTENLEFREIIKRYIEICNENQITSGIDKEIVEWIFIFPK